MMPEALLAELDESDAICRNATAPPWRHILDSFDPPEHFVANDAGVGHAICGPSEAMRENPDYEFIAHARTALPARNAQLRTFLDLLPWVQHLPGCDSLVNYGMGNGLCSCGLSEKLKAAGVE